MKTIYKCDKCLKDIKESTIHFSFRDAKKRFFGDWFVDYDLCDKCAKPLAMYVNKFLKNKKLIKNK